MAKSPADMKCYKKTIYKKQKIKIKIFFKIISFEKFHIRRALSHSFGTKAMAKSPADMKCYKKTIYKKQKNFKF
jgi:hypothetical protein